MMLREHTDYVTPRWARLLSVSVQLSWLVGDARKRADSARAEGKVPFIYYGGESWAPTLGIGEPDFVPLHDPVWKQVLSDLLFKGFLVLLCLFWGLGLILEGIKH